VREKYFSNSFLQNDENSPPKKKNLWSIIFFVSKEIELDIFLLVPLYFIFFILNLNIFFFFLPFKRKHYYLLTLGLRHLYFCTWRRLDSLDHHNVGVSEEKVRDPHLWPPITILMNRPYHKTHESCTSLVQVY
jgi:hypothetical protein